MLKYLLTFVVLAPLAAHAAVDRTWGYDSGQCLAGDGNLGGGITCGTLAAFPAGPLGFDFSLEIHESDEGAKSLLSFTYTVDPSAAFGAPRVISYIAGEATINSWSFDGSQFSISASNRAGSVNGVVGGGLNDAAACAATSDISSDCDWHAFVNGIGSFAGVTSSDPAGWQLVSTSEVPLPAAAWLFLTAIAGLGWVKRKAYIS